MWWLLYFDFVTYIITGWGKEKNQSNDRFEYSNSSTFDLFKPLFHTSKFNPRGDKLENIKIGNTTENYFIFVFVLIKILLIDICSEKRLEVSIPHFSMTATKKSLIRKWTPIRPLSLISMSLWSWINKPPVFVTQQIFHSIRSLSECGFRHCSQSIGK